MGLETPDKTENGKESSHENMVSFWRPQFAFIALCRLLLCKVPPKGIKSLRLFSFKPHLKRNFEGQFP